MAVHSETLNYWRCTYCSELNAPAIHRCSNCRHWREHAAPIEPVESRAPPLSPLDRERMRRVQAASPIRGALLFATWRRLPSVAHWHERLGIALTALICVVLAAARPYDDVGHLVTQMVFPVIFVATGAAVAARRYRTDGAFTLAVVVLAGVTTTAAYLIFYSVSMLLPAPDGRSLAEAIASHYFPDADPKAVVLILFALLVVAVIGTGAVMGRRSRSDGATTP